MHRYDEVILGSYNTIGAQFMAGLGTQNQKSVAPLVRRVQLRSAYNFLCLLYAKWSTRNKNGPHGVSHSPPVIQFDGPNFLFNVTPQYKNQVKLSAATLFWPYMPNPAIPILPCSFGPGQRHREFI